MVSADFGRPLSQPKVGWLRIAVALLSLAVSSSGAAMDFKLVPPQQPSSVYGTAWQIYATGDITETSAGELGRLLVQKKIPARSSIHMNSPGGSLLGGMELGRLIRKYGLYSYVAKQGAKSYEPLPGECYSACALAFLGGQFRWAATGSLYGVHRFVGAASRDVGSDVSQMLSSLVVRYMTDMGADPMLFMAMSFTAPTDIKVLSSSEMKELRVTNDGGDPPVWTLESMDRLVYLKGERHTWRGVNKFMIVCTPDKRRLLYVVFDAENREKEIMDMKSVSFLNEGRTPYPLGSVLINKTIENGWLNAMFNLDDRLLAHIRASQEAGIAFQYADGAGTFFGFGGFPLAGGQEKLKGLMNVCHAN